MATSLKVFAFVRDGVSTASSNTRPIMSLSPSDIKLLKMREYKRKKREEEKQKKDEERKKKEEEKRVKRHERKLKKQACLPACLPVHSIFAFRSICGGSQVSASICYTISAMRICKVCAW